ncbi:hypothetical protein [Qaidamihabitans albus]|uniref:hypothetical protein n=1 Tax=Qaidamihabitans albus TaxID=2795733 RepID=UPI0018F15DA4|nr:hypothetical protein [Qaidamihabitans albus]
MTNGAASRHTARCRFCGRPPAPGQHRLPGPLGPICMECVQAGLYLVGDGEERVSHGGTDLVRVQSSAETVCEFCGRGQRHSFLGVRRSLRRMRCRQLGSVICVDCLDRGGDLLNRALRQ